VISICGVISVAAVSGLRFDNFVVVMSNSCGVVSGEGVVVVFCSCGLFMDSVVVAVMSLTKFLMAWSTFEVMFLVCCCSWEALATPSNSRVGGEGGKRAFNVLIGRAVVEGE
jgi:hypothetical protein